MNKKLKATDKIRILVADDHAIMRDGIHSLLSQYDDIEIIGEAADGNETYKKTIELSPDVVIMDIGMPGMDGLETARRIRKKKSRVRILVLTQYESPEYLISAIKAGVSGYIPKKAASNDLVSALRSVCKGYSYLYPSLTPGFIQDYLTHVEKQPFDLLTSREREVLKLIADGFTSRQIADKLILSLKTVIGYRTKILAKLDIHNEADLIRYALKQGLVAVDNMSRYY